MNNRNSMKLMDSKCLRGLELMALLVVFFTTCRASAQSCSTPDCYVDSKTADSDLVKYGFEAYTNSHLPLIRIYHNQITTFDFYNENNQTGTNGYPIDPNNTSSNYGSVGDGPWNDDRSEGRSYVLTEYRDPITYEYSNNCSGSYDKTVDAVDNRSGSGGHAVNGTSWWRTYSYYHEEEHDTVQDGGTCDYRYSIPGGWQFVGTNIQISDAVGSGCDYGCPGGATNAINSCVGKDDGIPYIPSADNHAQYSYYDFWLNTDYYGSDTGSGYQDNSATRHLSPEYTDSELHDNLMAIMPAYPTNWSGGNGFAYSGISDDHNYGIGTKLKYRFKLPPRTETNTTYVVNWDIITVQQLNNSTNILTSVDTNNFETLMGTGDPTNFVEGAEHEIEVPPFYCTDDSGGICEKYVANVTVTIKPSGTPPGGGPGSGPSPGPSPCGGCSGPPPFGVPHDGGMQAEFGLGDTLFGRSSGFLRIWAGAASPALATPVALNFIGDASMVVLVTNISQLRQVYTSQALADIVTSNSFCYEIRYYYPSQVGGQSNGLYQLSGTPFVTWKVQNPNTTNSFNTLLLTETRGASSWVYSYNYNPTNNSWTTIFPGGLYQVQMITSNNVADGTRTLTQIISQTNGVSAKIFSRTYRSFSWGEGVVSETEGSGASAKTTTKTYHEGYSANGSFIPLKQVVHPDGNWEYYYYTQLADGTYAKQYVYSGFGDSQANGTASGSTYNSRFTLYVYYDPYAPLDSSDDGSIEPHTPRTVVEYVNSSAVSYRHVVFSPGQRKDIQRLVPWNDASDPNNLVTTTKYYTSGPNLFRVQSVENPNGTMSFYDYASSTNAWQTNTVSTGQPNGGKTAIVDGTQSISILDPLGRTVSVVSKDVVTGSTLQQEIYGSFDALDRAQLVTHLDGTSNVFNYACCYLESTVDRDGVTTVYLHDAAKRQYGQQKFYGGTNSITYQNVLDAAGRTVKTLRTGTDNSTITQSQSVYDTAGELLTQTNALSGKTTYAETYDGTTGGLIRTTTYPDGGTRIESHYVDGTLKSVTGTAVHPVRYEYGGGNDDMGNACSFTKEIKLLNDGSDSSEWIKTYTDLAGRTTESRHGNDYYDANWQYHSPKSCSYYNTQGQLRKQVDPDGVTTLYQYNAKGELAYTAISMSGSSATDIDWYNDRITWTTNDVTTAHSTTVRRSRTYAWTQDGVNSSSLLSLSETSANGLNSWQTRYGEEGGGKPVTSTHTTSFSGSRRTTIASAPDGSYTTNTYSYGRLISSTRYDSSAAQIGGTTYAYDAHGRQYQLTDARNGATTYGYNNADQVNSVAAPLSQTTTTLYDNTMRPYSVIQPDGTTFNTVYLLTGELGLQYGSRTYPVAYKYDYAGRMQTMTNWSTFSSLAGARVTTWLYDGSRGWLTNKLYADGNGPSYTYTPGGRLQTRAWVRGVTTSYAYDNAGSLTNIAYSDATPSVTNSYDRLGRLTQQSTPDYQLTSTYNLANELLVESFSGGVLNGLSVTNGYDQLLRRTNLTAKATSVLGRTTYGYDGASRLKIVSDGNNNFAGYTYLANSPLVSQIGFTNGTTQRMITTKSYDYLNRLTQIASTPTGSGAVPVNFNYTYNTANQRTKNTLVDGSYWVYQYDTLGQVTGGTKYFADGSLVPGQQFGYQFDDIGNRKQTTAGGDASGGSLRLANYSANNLNQITQRDYPGTNDVVGVALATNAVTVNGQTAWRKGEYFWSTVKSNNTAVAQLEGISVASGGTTNKGNLFVPKTPEQFSYDADGNLTNDGRWSYVWDAENRLIQMTVNTNVGPQYQLTFGYDAKSRRIQKIVATNGISISTNKFLYDGWNLVAELKPNNSLIRSYVWGTDLSGTSQGAGGVGGLLEISYYGSSITNCFPASDGNGNIMALVNAADGTIAANYDYAAFGEPIRITGVMARNNPFRFSTKYADDESDLLYYGYRYYKPSTGTWPSRDPINELGFGLLQNGDIRCDTSGSKPYAFVGNNPVSVIDLLGLSGYTPMPPYNPPDAGKPCCCTDPTVITAQRTDSAPSGNMVVGLWTLHESITLTIKGTCYKDLQIDWMTCWHGGLFGIGELAGYVGSGLSVDVPVETYPLVGNAWVTDARVFYLACEGGKWTKKRTDASLGYIWSGSSWSH